MPYWSFCAPVDSRNETKQHIEIYSFLESIVMTVSSHPRRRTLLLSGVSFPLASLMPLLAGAQLAWPNRSITLIAPNAPGGPADTLARAVANGMTKILNVPVVVENKPGASGKIGMQALLRAPRDGYTLAVTAETALSALPVFDKNVGYRSPADFEPLSLAVRTPTVWCVHPSMPVKSLRELVAYAKANPGKLNYASFGNNSATHLASENFFRIMDIKLTHIPYKSETEALNGLISGQVQVMMLSGASKPHITAKKIRGLATTSSRRWDFLPDIVTARETGIPELSNYSYEPWLGFSAAAGIPKEIRDRLSSVLRQSMDSPEVKKMLSGFGYQIIASSSVEMEEAIQQDLNSYRVLAQSGRVTPE